MTTEAALTERIQRADLIAVSGRDRPYLYCRSVR